MRIYLLLFFVTGLLFQAWAQTPTDKSYKEPEVLTSGDYIYPEFPGGDTAFIAFIKKNLVYPAETKNQSTAGNVFVSYIINEDGTVSDVKVVRGLSPACDQAAIDVVSKSPKWKPGTNNNMPVPVRRVVRVTFVAASDK